MTIGKKRGKWSGEEDQLILDGINAGKTTEQVLQDLINHDHKGRSRELETVKKRMDKLKVETIAKTSFEDNSDLRNLLHSKEYYPYLLQQFTTQEMAYFEGMWVELMQQFRHDVLASEELQLKELITVDILMSRGLVNSRRHMEQCEKLEKVLSEEYSKDDDDPTKDMAYIANLEQQIAQMRNSVAAFTTEYTKLNKEKEALSKALKANRDARIKRIEDSKTSWAGLIRALEDEKARKNMGQEAELMRLAKDKVKKDLSEWHTYIDGNVDQPLLTPETVKADDE